MVKVTLDLSKLLRDGAITAEEHNRLVQLGRRDTGTVLTNALVGFGVVAVSAGAVAALPSILTAMAIGVGLMALGAWLVLAGRARWRVLATICILVATLMLGSGLVLLSGDVVTDPVGGNQWALMPTSTAFLVVAALFTGSAILAGSALMAALAVLMLFAALGSTTAYEHAMYMVGIEQPLATVVLFAVLAATLHAAAPRLPGEGERLANAAARTALLLVNMGFWVGSLWGDNAGWLLPLTGHGAVPAVAFTIAWAAALVLAAFWAGQTNRRWALNLIIVFGGIHFYTQWFEHLGATPLSLLGGGVLMLAFAVGLWRLNERMTPLRTGELPVG